MRWVRLIVTMLLGLACAPRESRREVVAPERTATWPIDYKFVEDVVTRFYARDFDAVEKKFHEYEDYFENSFDGEQQAVAAFAAFRQASGAAQKIVEEWVARSPDSYVALLAYGSYFEEMGWRRRDERYVAETTEIQFREMDEAFRKAIPSFEKAASLRPRLTVSYANLIDIYRALGDREERDRWLERGLEARPDSYTVRNHYMEGLRPRWGGSIEEMEAFAAEAEELAGVNPRLRRLHGVVKSELGERAFRTDPRRALALHEESLAFGEDSFFLYRKAETLDALGEYDEALAAASRALERSPAWVWPMVMRANLREKTGDREGALEDLARALKLDSHNPNALLARAYIHKKSERFRESRLDVDEALSIRPYWVDAWVFKAGLLLRDLKEEEAAYEAMERAGELGSTSAQLSLGWRYLRGPERDYEKAYRWFSAAAAGDDANAMCQLGIMYQQGYFVKTDPSEAARWYYRAALGGYHAGRHNLGLLYLYGYGVAPDIGRGYLLIASAAALGEQSSIDYLETMESRLTPEQLEEGRARLAAGEDGLEEPPG